jgi:hypothetical protein
MVFMTMRPRRVILERYGFEKHIMNIKVKEWKLATCFFKTICTARRQFDEIVTRKRSTAGTKMLSLRC